MERGLRSGLTLLVFLVGTTMHAPANSQDTNAQDADWSDLTLWYRQPAAQWNHALPLGNGRLGAMVFGATAAERIQLNEETFWAGGPYDPTNPGGAEALPEIQRLLFAGDIEKAHDLFGRTMMGIPYEQMNTSRSGISGCSFLDTKR